MNNEIGIAMGGYLDENNKIMGRPELDRRISAIQKENLVLRKSIGKICDEINHGEHLDLDWIKDIVHQEVTHPYIDAATKMNNIYKKENQELRKELEWAVDVANYWVDNKSDKQKCCDLEYKYKLKIDHGHEE